MLLLALAGCRYTFWPLIPPEVPFPNRVAVSGTLEPKGSSVRAAIEVRRWPEPNYLELRWFKGDELAAERSVWIERPQRFEVTFPYTQGALYRLLLIAGNRPLLQLDLGEPNVPPPPSAPAPAPAEGSGN